MSQAPVQRPLGKLFAHGKRYGAGYIGLAAMILAVWTADGHRLSILMFAVGVVQLVLWRMGIRLEREFGEYQSLRMNDADLAHLLDLRRHLPAEPPDGWSSPCAHPGEWYVDAGAERIYLRVPSRDASKRLHVTVSAERPGARLTSERVRELVVPLLGVGTFVEVAQPSGRERVFAAERLPVPALAGMQPGPVRGPDRRHLAMRRHLPARMPPGWSAPVAARAHGDDDRSSWFMETPDGYRINVTLWDTNGRKELMVLLSRHDQEEVTSTAASAMLSHFRDVAEFREMDAEDWGLPGARGYIGHLVKPGDVWVN